MRITTHLPRPRRRSSGMAVIVAALLALVALGLWARGWLAAPVPAESPAISGAGSLNDRIIDTYQAIVREQPGNLDAHATLGLAYIQKAREQGDPSMYGRAEALFERVLRDDPKHLEALIGTGQLALAQHRFRDALIVGERALAVNPTVSRVYGLIADAQIELGQYEQAVETIQIMVDLRPDLASYSRVAYARELHGDQMGAIEAMTLAVRAGGPTVENTEWTRTQLGLLSFGMGDLAGAEGQFALSLARLPDYAPALAGMARVRAAQGDFAAARELYGQAIARMPLPEYVVALGELEQAAGRPEEAARQYELARVIERLFESNGVNGDLSLALFEADHGDPQAALALAEAAYAERPGIRGAEVRAWALYSAGRIPEAQAAIAEAMRLGTRDATLHYRAAMIALAAGDPNAARAGLHEALAINPHFSPLYAQEARRVLDELGSATSKTP